MAYSELIKDVSRIRVYMREFFAYGFRSRDEVGTKSLRSYDNEKRRIESWLGDFMSFRQDAAGKAVFLSVDSRLIPHNPLYKAWKAASFTKNDINLHFILLDLLADGRPRALSELIEAIDAVYLSPFDDPEPVDESTLRKKLREYTDEGLLAANRSGRRYRYALASDSVDLEAWRDAADFFSEAGPLGVVGSFILDKYAETKPAVFSFKHRYLLFALDSGVMLELLAAIRARRKVELELAADRAGARKRAVMVPLKLFIGTQGGRQYVAGYNLRTKKNAFFRLDAIEKVKLLETAAEFDTLQRALQDERARVWGVSCGRHRAEHIEMTLAIGPKDGHILNRLAREKRCGTVTRTAENMWRFCADVYDARELLPWLRTFIGRIVSLTCSNEKVERQFWTDCRALTDLYGGDGHAV